MKFLDLLRRAPGCLGDPMLDIHGDVVTVPPATAGTKKNRTQNAAIDVTFDEFRNEIKRIAAGKPGWSQNTPITGPKG